MHELNNIIIEDTIEAAANRKYIISAGDGTIGYIGFGNSACKIAPRDTKRMDAQGTKTEFE